MNGTLLAAHTPEKIALYLDFTNMVINLLKNPASKKNTRGLGIKMLNIGLGIMILAPDPVAKAYIFWVALSEKGDDPEALINAFGDLVMEMRKDLIGETECSRDDAVGIFLKDEL